MYLKQECVAMLLAGGQGSRLYALTRRIAKPAVPYGGKYRIIDFPLSNCVNSGIRDGGRADAVSAAGAERLYRKRAAPWDLDRIEQRAFRCCRPISATRAATGIRAQPTPSIRI